MKEIISHIIHISKNTFNDVIIACSAALSFLLTEIGYPERVVTFIFALCIIDILTKWFSIVIVNYDDFTLKNFFRAWHERKLTSRGIKNGTCVKVILYTPVLFIAHQLSIIDQMIGGALISNTMYSILIITESISILENLTDCGLDKLKPIIIFFKRKEKELVNIQEGDEDNDLRNTI